MSSEDLPSSGKRSKRRTLVGPDFESQELPEKGLSSGGLD